MNLIQKRAQWLNIWHHYTVDGCPRHYRTEKSLDDFDMIGRDVVYHGFNIGMEKPGPPKLRLIGYDSDSVAPVKRIVKPKHKKAITRMALKRAVKNNLISSGIVCCYCEQPLNDEIFTWDHLIPISKGGVNLPVNKRPSCYRCNYEKGSKDMGNYIRFLKKIPQNDRVKKALENACKLFAYITINRDKLILVMESKL